VHPVEWPAADSLLLYTDGLIDAHAGLGSERLGVEGLTDLVVRLVAGGRYDGDPDGLVDEVITAVQATDRGRSEDDIAVMHLSWQAR
jgi:serine phosphatase RsbU (regulator of sigma subunit)